MKTVARIGLAACAAGWGMLLAPFASAQPVDVVSDLSYGPDPTQLFDWYKAKSTGSSATPLVVFQHGGAGVGSPRRRGVLFPTRGPG